ncbi:MAG: CAP domain-containing protein [Acidimicrobiia bacterium]
MSTRTATILVIVVSMFVIGGTALAIGGQFGASSEPVSQAADSPAVSTTEPEIDSDLSTSDLSEFDPSQVSPATAPPTTVRPEATTTTAAPTTTTSTAPPTTTTTTSAPTTTTTKPAPTTTTAPPTTTTTKPAPTTTTTPPPPPTTTTTTASGGGSFSGGSESQFVSLINGVRADLGVPALSVSSSLTSYARDWSFHMSDTGNFAHSNIGSLLGSWSTVGENIAYGWSVNSMHNALVASPGHYANLTNASFTHIGVGVWIEEGGKIWTTHVFGG